MNKSIIVKEIEDDNINVLNDYKNCIICCSTTEPLILMINNFCECFQNVFICEKCFIKWLFKNNKCFICRVKFTNEDNYRFYIYDIQITELFIKILVKIEQLYINIPNNSEDSNTIGHYTSSIFSFYYNIITKNNLKLIIFFIFVFFSIFCISQFILKKIM